jgi:hypothetical protein
MNGDQTRHKVVKNYHGLMVTGYHQAENDRWYATLVINEGVFTMAMLDTEIGH